MTGESTADHFDLLDDSPVDAPVEREHGYPHDQQQQQQQQQPQQQQDTAPRNARHRWQSLAEQEEGETEGMNPDPMDDVHGDGASVQSSRQGRGEGRRFDERWEGEAEGGEGRAWKHEDLKQLLQVLRLW